MAFKGPEAAQWGEVHSYPAFATEKVFPFQHHLKQFKYRRTFTEEPNICLPETERFLL